MDFYFHRQKKTNIRPRTKRFKKEEVTPNWVYHWDTLLSWNKTIREIPKNICLIERRIDDNFSVLSLLITEFCRNNPLNSQNIISLPIVYLGPDNSNRNKDVGILESYLKKIADNSTTKYGPTTIWAKNLGPNIFFDDNSKYFDNLGQDRFIGTPLYHEPEKISPLILTSFSNSLPNPKHESYHKLEEIVYQFRKS